MAGTGQLLLALPGAAQQHFCCAPTPQPPTVGMHTLSTSKFWAASVSQLNSPRLGCERLPPEPLSTCCPAASCACAWRLQAASSPRSWLLRWPTAASAPGASAR